MKYTLILLLIVFSLTLQAQQKSIRINGTGAAVGAVPLSDNYGTLSYSTQSANRVLASPNGSTGIVSLRLLVAGDIPSIDATKITTGTLTIARGGTGLTALGSSLQQIRVNAGATALEYFTPSAGSTPTLDQITTAGNTTTNTITVGNVINSGNLSNMGGSIRLKYRTAADGETLQLSDHTVSGNTSGGNCTLTLPTGSSYYGIEYYINSSALLNTLTIQTSGSDTITFTTVGNNSLIIPHACIIRLTGTVWTVYSLY